MFIISLIFLGAVSAVRPVYACLIAGDEKQNRFSIAKEQVNLEDIYEDQPRTPGETFQKIVAVENNGTCVSYPVVQILFSDSRWKKYCTCNINENVWSYSAASDCYYYNRALQPGEKTEPLFTEVTLQKETPEEFCKDFEMIIFMNSSGREDRT